MFVTVQVRILQKHHEKQPKSLKQARDVEKSVKLKLKMKIAWEKPVTTSYFLKAQKDKRDA